MTARPTLTIADIEAHQDAKGLRKYPTTLEDAGLSRGALALHALEEMVDHRRYMRAAGLWTRVHEFNFNVDAETLLSIADHPEPLPPDVPTVEAVARWGRWWQLGDAVVEVCRSRDGLMCWHAGHPFAYVCAPSPGWRGPVTLRGGR